MKLHMKQAARAVLVAFLMSTPVVFASTTGSNQTVGEIILKQEKIQADAKDGRQGWDNIPKAKRDELAVKQERLFALLEGKSSISELNAPEKTEALDTLGWIDDLALKAADEREVCTKERKTGSNFVQMVCRSAGSLRREREMAREGFRRGEQATRMALPAANP